MNKFITPISEFAKGMLIGAAIVCAMIWAIVLLSGCSHRAIVITPGMVNATSTTLLYCPEATVTRVQDGNRTVDMVGDGSGVGPTLKGIVEGLR